MKIFVTGATGFVGGALCLRLRQLGHEVVAWVRTPEKASFQLGPEIELLATDAGDEALRATLAGCDGVVNLAGDPLFSGRWNPAKKKRMTESRVDLTRGLVAAMAACGSTPKVLVSASAIGIYGDTGDAVLDEDSPHADDFLGRLARDWEAAARGAEAAGVRVVIPRLGIVLGPSGGALAQMLPPFLFGAGGPLGSGRQVMSWVDLDDLVELIAAALTDESYAGVYNATAPQPVTNKTFSKALGRALRRPAFMPAPGFAVRLLLGEAAGVLLGGQDVRPRRLEDRGFAFRSREIDACLARLFGPADDADIRTPGVVPESEYLARNPPAYHLRYETFVPSPVEAVADFLSRPGNLGPLTPGLTPILPADATTPADRARPVTGGETFDLKVGLGPLWLTWRTVIERASPGDFVDVATKGPYRTWWHRHRVEARPGGAAAIDDVYYAPPLGPVGRLANAVLVAPMLRLVFGARALAMRRRFGDPDAPATAAPEEVSRAA